MVVAYSTPSGDPEERRMCTTRGNNVFITFEEIEMTSSITTSFESSRRCLDAGDLPELDLDQYNAPQDASSALSTGDGSKLELLHNTIFDRSGDEKSFAFKRRDVSGVILSPHSTEVQKGSNIADRRAALVSIEDDLLEDEPFANMVRSRLTFRYIVCEGDHTDDLEYRAIVESSGGRDAARAIARVYSHYEPPAAKASTTGGFSRQQQRRCCGAAEE